MQTAFTTGSFATLAVLCVLALPARASTAKQTFGWYCVQCHDKNGTGKGVNLVDELPVGPMNLSDPKNMVKYSDAQIINTITHGGPVNQLDSLMPTWGGVFTEQEIKGLMRYVRTLCKGTSCPK